MLDARSTGAQGRRSAPYIPVGEPYCDRGISESVSGPWGYVRAFSVVELRCADGTIPLAGPVTK